MRELKLPLISIPERQCSYLPDRSSRTLFVQPQIALDSTLYSTLLEAGYRRSGELVYTPQCDHCVQCTSIKIDPQTFRPSRSQKRCMKRNADLQLRLVPARYSDEYLQLYRRYMGERHAGGGMDDPTEEAFREFLYASWSNTVFLEMRKDKSLLGVAVIDLVDDGLSAVYTFYDPAEQKRGLGNFAVLWQLQLAKRRPFKWVYLGYWIEDSKKMAYKAKYRPALGFRNQRWQSLEALQRQEQESSPPPACAECHSEPPEATNTATAASPP